MRPKMLPQQILCAYAEPAAGPGWANQPVWWIWRDGDGVLHQECIQPEEHTQAMATLYGVSSAAHAAMTRAVRDYATPKRGKR